MLELKNVSKFYYSKNTVASGFNKINLKLDMGEFVVITGESGSGKSTLLNVISGLDTYEEGEMYIEGVETSGYTETEFENYRKKYIGKIFQSFNLINSYTVYQNIELVMLINGLKKKDIKAKVMEVIEKVELTKYKNTKVSKISGGQKQRVAIARALIKESPIIVADEPTGNLDSVAAENIMQLLSSISKDKLVVIVTHDYELVQKYATRKITMHDGKIIEDKHITLKKNEDKNEKVPEFTEYKRIRNSSKLKLGIRNTFNIFPKFILLLFVYLILNIAVLGGYSVLQKIEYEDSKNGYNSYFVDTDDRRIIIQKKDLTEIKEEDYKKIEELSNIDHIIKNDIFLDTYFGLNGENYGVSGSILNIKMFKNNVIEGRMPENDKEIILEIPKDFGNMKENVLNKEFSLSGNQAETLLEEKVTVVGIAYYEPTYYYYCKIYLEENKLDEVRKKISIEGSKIEAVLNENVLNCSLYGGKYQIIPSKQVKEGNAIVPEELNFLCKNYNCKNYDMQIKISTIYYDNDLEVKISNTFNKNNIKKLLKIEDYQRYSQSIFINDEEYYTLYNKGMYQSSVFVKDVKLIDETLTELEDLNYKVLPIKDTLISYDGMVGVIGKAFIIVVTVIVMVALFFISYFVIKIIIKSRNVYFSTIRILGATRKNAKEILRIELLTILNLSYTEILILVYLIKSSIIQVPFIEQLLSFLKMKEYVIMYVILFIISLLISNRYAKQLFKKSAMSTYREEV